MSWFIFFPRQLFLNPPLSLTGIIHPSKDYAKLYAAVGSAITLPCVFSPGLFPVKPALEKLKPGSLFLHTPDRLPASFIASSPSSQPTSDHSATLNEVEFEDQGTYRCSGVVKGQWLTRNMQLVVAKSKPPQIQLKLECQLFFENVFILNVTVLFFSQLTAAPRQRKETPWHWPANWPTQAKSSTTNGFMWSMTSTAPSQWSPSRRGRL